MIDQEKPPLEELAHHGVKGQKWGVRKEKAKSAVAKTKSGAQVAAKKSGEAAQNYMKFRNGVYSSNFLPAFFGNPIAQAKIGALATAETATISAGYKAIKKMDTEIQVAKLRRSMKNL